MKEYYCANCGKHGHIYKNCVLPVMSYGVILYRNNAEKKREYLMIRRKHTLGYVEFLRGKYSIDNVNYIIKLLSIMTLEERKHILTRDFDDLWQTLWIHKTKKQYFNEYENSKSKFYKIKLGYEHNDMYLDFDEYIKMVHVHYEEAEWGFPKGRRNLYESDMDCAQREFEEETGLKINQYKLVSGKSFNECFFGSNNIRYKHVYYLGELLDEHHVLSIDETNYNQYSEIGHLKWASLEECLNMIRPYNIEKKNLISEIDSIKSF